MDLTQLTYDELVKLRKKALQSKRIVAFGEISEHLEIDPSSYKESSEERDLWDKYITEKMWLADQISGVSYSVPVLDVSAESNDIVRYRISSYSSAKQIIDNFSRSESYLRSLVTRVTGNPSYASSLNYRELLHEGYKIKGVANRILGSKRGIKR